MMLLVVSIVIAGCGSCPYRSDANAYMDSDMYNEWLVGQAIKEENAQTSKSRHSRQRQPNSGN